MSADRRLTPLRLAASAAFGAKSRDGTRSFRGVAYGGGVIADHPVFDRVAFDLGSTRLDTPAPALLDHREPVGVIESAIVAGRIEIGGRLFADVEGPSKRVADLADRGMPWQMSVGIWPGRIEELRAGSSVALNGQTIAGPLTIFRENRVREVSFVALGADTRTSAEVFAIGKREAPQDRRPTTAEAIADAAAALLHSGAEISPAAAVARVLRG